MRQSLTLALVLMMSGCVQMGSPVVKVIAKLSGNSMAWFRVDPLLTLDADGAVLLPPAAALDEEDPTPYMERVRATHERQFIEQSLEARTPCTELDKAAQEPGGTVYVLVHGIGGMGSEWFGVIPTLAKSGATALYMYKWFAYAERGVILRGLVTGIERVAQCYPTSRVVVLGHSAGGVLAAFAASRLKVTAPLHPIEIITVASPLAGVGAIPEVDDGDDATAFFNDLGAVRHGYAAATAGVTVLHLRTSYPADNVMRPTRGGYSPNAISATVKGSRILDLPGTLNHSDSLLYVVRQLAAGRLP